MTGTTALSEGPRNNELLALPAGPLIEPSLAAARAAVHPSVLNHSIRGFYWARLFAAHKGVLNDADYDEELLFAAHVMHDLGTGPDAPGRLRFEMEGADLRHLTDEVLAHGARSETAAPPYAIAYLLAREREADIAAWKREQHTDIASAYDWDGICIADFEKSLNYDVSLIRNSPGTPEHIEIHGLFYDIDSGELTEVVRDVPAETAP